MFCNRCHNNTFHSIDNCDLVPETFKSNELCSCYDVTKDLRDYKCLETITELSLNNINLNQVHPNADNDIDTYLYLNTTVAHTGQTKSS